MELELWVGAEGTLDGVTHWHGSSLFCAISVMQLPELVAKSETCCSCALPGKGLNRVVWHGSPLLLTVTLVRFFARCLGCCADVLPLLAALTLLISGVLSGTDQSSWDLQED